MPRVSALRSRLEAEILAVSPEAVIFGSGVDRLPNTTLFAVPDFSAATVVIGFDLEGIAVSAGSACSSGKIAASHVLEAMGEPPGRALRRARQHDARRDGQQTSRLSPSPGEPSTAACARAERPEKSLRRG